MNYFRRSTISAWVIAASLFVLPALACNSSSANPQNTLTDTIDNEDSVVMPYASISDIDTAKAREWACSVMNALTPDERVAQLFMPRLDISANAAGIKQLTNAVTNLKVGGILLGKGSIETYATLFNRAQKEARLPLLISLDGEWGLAMRVPGTPKFPSNVALGAMGDCDLMYEYGKEMARECREMGIQVNFAPDLDVNSNPENPVIGYRSFGEDPQLVADLGTYYCVGMEEGGVMSVGKHFPGHGDTNVDSHKALPTIDHEVGTLQIVDMWPFQQAIECGMSGVMVGHLRVPSLDASGTPASLSKAITTDWLQDSLGFKGLIFTDALAMKGASRPGENNCVSALLAGADVLLGSAAPATDIAAVKAAVKAGKISQQEIDRRCLKLLKYKYQLGLDKAPMVNTDGLAARLNSREVNDLIKRMSERCITLVRDSAEIVPIDTAESVAVVSIGADAKNQFSSRCRELGEHTTFYSATSAKPLTAADIAKIGKADRVVIAVFNNASWAEAVLSKLSKQQGSVGVFFINPFKTARLKAGIANLKAVVMAYDDIPAIRVAAADAIFGQIDVSGKMPVNIPGVASMGEGIIITSF